MIELTVMDATWVKTNREGCDALNNLLSYNDCYFRKTGYGPEKVIQKCFCIETGEDNETFYFLSGFLDKCLACLDRWKLTYSLENLTSEVDIWPPHIEGYEFRAYQEDLIEKAIDGGRGLIVSPTGTGKSVALLGVMSAFRESNILFLVHTNDLIDQLYSDITTAFPKENIGHYTGKKKNRQRITLATIQTWHKKATEFSDWADVIIIDEAHHVSDFWGMYGKVLANATALTKLGFTATIGTSEKARFAAEGLLGPVIGEFKNQEAMDRGVIHTPDIWIYTIAENPHCSGEYRDKYLLGITTNLVRNLKIIAIAKKLIKMGKTCLITITSIEHGNILQEMAVGQGLDIPFVYGESSKAERDFVKDGLSDGTLRCAIASVIFIEGIDIPSLDSVINAGAGKSAIQSVQRSGRALRKADGKTEAIIVDFLDQVCSTFQRQSEERFKVYKSRGYKLFFKKG